MIGEGESGGIRTFPARIESSRRADVAFRVPGRVEEILVREGERVEEGQVLAKLDPTDYQLVVDDRQATLDRVEKDFDRAKELIVTGFIPRRDYDRIESEFKSATAALRQAMVDLSYATLRAPFQGELARRYIEAFEEVEANQVVFALRDISLLEVKFDVPEQIMIRLQEADEGDQAPDPDVFVSFDVAPENVYELEFKEIAATADPSTQTFEASFTMTAPEDLRVLPGMTANVLVDLSRQLGSSEITYVPVEAVISSNDLEARVWIVDEDTMTVAPRAV
ncbi:MAG: efflux RND transporter periplasmic adaptor subunit, partial [Alphaproteobacteria bacterium]